jgi:hypothetical protein
MLSQLLLGERVLVEEERDGWVRGIALDQPAGKLDPRGYPGWLRAADLGSSSTVDGEWYVVDVPAAVLFDAPDGRPVLSGVVLGTRLAAAGPPRRGWLAVRVPGHDRPLWIRTEPEPADVVATARQLLGVPYLWGGMSAGGIDCSGLVHLSWRRCGVTLPRDADDQHRATVPVPIGEERPGDLYFFAREGKPVHHVGIVTGPRRMVHASYTDRRVVDEDLHGDRAATLVAAGRV